MLFIVNIIYSKIDKKRCILKFVLLFKGHQLEIARDYCRRHDDPPGFEVRQIDDYIGKIFLYACIFFLLSRG